MLGLENIETVLQNWVVCWLLQRRHTLAV